MYIYIDACQRAIVLQMACFMFSFWCLQPCLLQMQFQYTARVNLPSCAHIYIDIYTYMSMKEITWARHSEMCSQTFRVVERLIGRRAIHYETFVAKNMSPISHNPNKWIFNEDMNLWTFGIIIIQFTSCQHRTMQMASFTYQVISFPNIANLLILNWWMISILNLSK